MEEKEDGVVCLFSANVALHFCDSNQIVPTSLVGRKLIADEVVTLPSAANGGQDVKVVFDGQTLVFQGVNSEIEVEGSSANIAYISRGLGHQVLVAAAVGRDYHGRIIHFTFDRDQIYSRLFLRQGGTAITAAVTNPSGQTTLFCVKPPYEVDPNTVVYGLADFGCSCVAATSIRTYEELELTRRVFQSYPDIVKAFIPHRELLLKESGFISPLFGEVLWLADVIQVNEREANLLGKGPAGESSAFSPQDLKQVVDKLARFKPDVLIVTLGAKGAVSVAFRNHGYEIFDHPAYNLKPVDTTGSGDAFLAAFLHAYQKKVSHQETVDFASRIAARNAAGRGGHYVKVTPQALEEFLANEKHLALK